MTFSSEYYIAAETVHDCPGENCAVCRILAVSRTFLATLFAAAVPFAAVLSTVHKTESIFFRARFAGVQTLITLKVKLSS